VRQILITNDDGIQSPALEALEVALSDLGSVVTVAPDREMSATSHCITLNQPLRYEQQSPGRFAVQGTPADCVILASLRILSEPPALVVSGVNRGANVGDDISYSGTVAAAFEAALQGIPAIAVSTYAQEKPEFAGAALVAARIAALVLQEGLPPDVILNVNYPPRWNGEFRFTRQGRKAAKRVLVDNLDLHEDLHHEHCISAGTDYEALAAGYVSITPLQINRTAQRFLDRFSNWTEYLESRAKF
jgi:5'-nucleotidase